jgi:hypothetical protein
MTKYVIPLLMCCSLAFGAELPESRHPGGVAVLPVGDAEFAMPIVHFGEQRVMVRREGDQWVAVVGISLDQPTGPTTLHIDNNPEHQVEFEILPHAYREQRLSVERKYVDLSTEQLDRVTTERTILDNAIGAWRSETPESLELHAPVDGKRSSSFGLRRFFNDQPRSPHKGMDIAAVKGTPSVAPGSGLVAVTGDFYFNGNTVILDHGQGFVTLYCHLDVIDVTAGNSVQTGDIVGKVGATGRVTGAHLHFSTYLNGTAVDPALFITSE